ncbi:SapC family protein [Poseidonocella sp. HB161398]|uniref:SapC family protein n=1 Tax=Poseidonocella sp. HB161398 TaxID=2320855 RepID=UPI001485EEF1|nr:SapC family protein [Poseidonocella sp. HB161398]
MAHSIFADGEMLASERHARLSYFPEGSYRLCAGQATAPVTLAEFSEAARDHPILFAGSGSTTMPVALMGLAPGENLFVDAEGHWTGGYIPAHFRQLPFYNTEVRDTGKVVLSILPGSGELRDDGAGLPLFDVDGQPGHFLREVMNFTRAHYQNTIATGNFCKLLEALELLEPMQWTTDLPGRGHRAVSGFRQVSRARLAGLPQHQTALLAERGMLDAIRLHLDSIRNLVRLALRATEGAGQADAAQDGDTLDSVASIARRLARSVS